MIIQCIVCEHELDSADADSSIVLPDEARLFFCSAHCREEFDTEPAAFLESEEGDLEARPRSR